MKISDVQFPTPLLSALRSGSLVVFAGAGVSAGKPASIHDFSALTEAIARDTGQTRLANESEDVFLGRLQHRGVLVHDIAARFLRKNRFGDIPKPTSLHHDLLRLYPEPGAVRIVTTNFDLLFAYAAREVFAEQPETFMAPALPLGQNFNGIVHVHGCLDRRRDMVLTDADFGRAYLTEGWARRFLVELFRSSTVLFVGYSHNDTVMKYLARALPARESQRRFALTSRSNDDHWPVLGIEPISYPQESDVDHSSLNEGIRGLAHYAGCGLLDWRHEITEIARRPPSPDEREADIIDEALADATRAQFFADAATHPEWLDWLDRRGHLAPLFGSADLTDPHLPIAEWMVDRFAFDHPQALFRLVGRHGMTFHPQLWHRLAQVITFSSDRGLSNELLSRWVSCLLSTASPLPDTHQLLYLAQQCSRAGLVVLLVEIFDAVAGHGLSLRPPFPGLDDEFAGHPDLPAEDIDVGLTADGNVGVFRKLWQTELTPRLDLVAEPVLSIAISRLAARHRTFLLWQKADREADLESIARRAIEPQQQGHDCDHVDVLIDAARDCLEWLAHNCPEEAAGWCSQLARSETPLLRRLGVHTLLVRNDLSACQKLDWLFGNIDLHDYTAHHELFRIMRELYPQADPERRERVIDIIRAFSWPDDVEEQGARLAALHQFDWLHWLHESDPDCESTKAALDDVRNRHPEFAPQDHPDLLHWSHSRVGPDHPWSVEELLSRPARDWLEELLLFSPDSPLGPKRQDAISAVSAAAEREFRWGTDLAAALGARDRWDSDLWIALFRAWRKGGLNHDRLNRVFEFLHEPRLSKAYAGPVADILLSWLKETDAPKNGDLLQNANAIAAQLWQLIERGASPKPCDSWHSLAIGNPAGTLAKYWLQQRSLLRDGRDSLPDSLVADVIAALTAVVHDPSVPGLQGRAVLTGQLAFLLDTEEEWAREHLIPRFTQQPGTEDYQAMWDGFLTHGRFTPVVGECLKVAFLEAVSLMPVHFEGGWRLDRFVDAWTLMLAYRSDDPVGTWIPKFFEQTGHTARHRFASEIGRHLRQMNDSKQRGWWERWLKSYWTRRLDGIPEPLDEGEIRLIFNWLPTFESLFPTAVELGVRMPSLALSGGSVIHDLWRGNHTRDFPEAVGRLLIHLGDHASPSSAWYRGREVISTLHSNADLPNGLRKPLLELAARLGPA